MAKEIKNDKKGLFLKLDPVLKDRLNRFVVEAKNQGEIQLTSNTKVVAIALEEYLNNHPL